MSTPEENSEKRENTLPEDIPAPPPIMPRPDIKDGSQEGPTYGTGEKKKKKSKKDRSRSHPLDPYEPLKKRRGCGGVCGCFAILAVLFLLLVLAVAWMGPGKYVFQGYEVVNLEETESIVSEAPEGPTCYIGQTVDYRVAKTEFPIAIIGAEVTVSGDFYEDLSVTAAKLTATSSTRIAGDLEVYVAEFYDEGIELRGELTGQVMNNKHP